MPDSPILSLKYLIIQTQPTQREHVRVSIQFVVAFHINYSNNCGTLNGETMIGSFKYLLCSTFVSRESDSPKRETLHAQWYRFRNDVYSFLSHILFDIIVVSMSFLQLFVSQRKTNTLTTRYNHSQQHIVFAQCISLTVLQKTLGRTMTVHFVLSRMPYQHRIINAYLCIGALGME